MHSKVEEISLPKNDGSSIAPTDLLAPAPLSQLILLALKDWAWICLFWAIGSILPPRFYFLEAVLVAAKLHALGVILHDLCHQKDSNHPKYFLLEALCGYPIASTVSAMRYHHLRHHRDSCLDGDPYFKDLGGKRIRLIPYYFLGLTLVPAWVMRPFIGIFAAQFPWLRNFYGRYFLQDRSNLDLTHQPELIQCAKEQWRQVLFWIMVFTALYLWPSTILFHYLIPLEIAGVFSIIRLLGEHHYDRAKNRHPSEVIRTTRNHHLNWIAQFFLAPHFNGYHIVHHLYPHCSLFKLKQLHQWWLRTQSNLG